MIFTNRKLFSLSPIKLQAIISILLCSCSSLYNNIHQNQFELCQNPRFIYSYGDSITVGGQLGQYRSKIKSLMFKIDNQTGSVHFKGKAIDWDVSDPLPGANIVIATLDKDSLEFSWRFYIKCIASADRDGIFTLSCNLGKQDVLFIKMQGYNSLVYNIGKFI